MKVLVEKTKKEKPKSIAKKEKHKNPKKNIQYTIYEMFSKTKYSGKHLILDIKNIRNKSIIDDLEELKSMMDTICISNNFTVLQRIEEIFEPQGLSIIYLLSESHMSIHTFPEKNYIAFDLYTCREYETDDEYKKIHEYIIKKTKADYEEPIIITRKF